MASVNEWIVREYLEALGFLVRQPRKYQVMARAKGAYEELDLLAVNPALPQPGPLSKERIWGAAELAQVSSAIIAIRGWHSEKFTAAILASLPDMYRFAEPEVVRLAEADLGQPNPAKILCLADLPADPDQRAQALAFLRTRGIDGVILYRPMLLELTERIDVKRNYEKSDLLQILRILKNYDLLKSGQLELFTPFRRRRAVSAAPVVPEETIPLPQPPEDETSALDD